MKAFAKLFVVMLVAAFALVAIGGKAVAQDKATPEELAFLKDGPRLYPMAQALELSKETGKPVVCWMGKHLFADPRARKLSSELGETTIQAAMDADGTEYDKLGFRVKFSSGNYAPEAKTYTIRLANFDKPATAEYILAVSRGGSPTRGR